MTDPTPNDRAADAPPNAEPARRVCVVEDDATLRDLLTDYLARNGVNVCAFPTAEALLHSMGTGARPLAIVMDIGLPGISGLEACQRLRRHGDATPIILLTARDEEVDRVIGLEMGADDYVGKPYSARELLARVRAALRRGSPAAAGSASAYRAVGIGDHTFLPELRRLHRGTEVRALNAIEFALLAELTGHPGEAISRERLLSVSHPGEGAVLLRAVDAAIMRLRKLLEREPANPRYLLTVRFQGYMFVPDASAAPTPFTHSEASPEASS